MSNQRGSSPFRMSVNGNLLGYQQSSFGQSFNSSHSSSPASRIPRHSTPNRGSRGLAQLNERNFSPVAVCYSPSLMQSSDESVDFPGNSGKDRENICVTIRFRPLSEREIHRGDEAVWYVDGDTVRSEYNPSAVYAFDKVFGGNSSTRNVYDTAARHVIRGAMGGINGTVFAYGVTSSGKTHTMHGDQNFPGIIPLAIKDVFSIIQETAGRQFLLRVSYLEIYNEVINDLLDPAGQNLRVREDAQGTYVEGIKEEVVLSPAHALSLIAAGEEHRHVGSNNFNLFSSRSHTIFTLTIESNVRVQGSDDEVTLSQLNLIDLAGSESSKTETTGLRRKEGSYINKSLLTLGTVISKLSEGKASHIPYRDSKLTRLLQSSLSGNGRISLICTITPASSNMEETHNTLKFAQRAKRIAIYAGPNKIIDEKSLIKKYQKEIVNLKQELQHIKRGMLEGPYLMTNQEDIITLRQQLEAGQMKMQSRLEEEEQAKAALMGRIHKLTKLILVSTKSNLSGAFPEIAHQRRHSLADSEERYDDQSDIESCSIGLPDGYSNPSFDTSLDITESHTGKHFPSNDNVADQMDLTREQVKMLSGEIALRTSSLKRLSEQATSNPDDFEIQIQIKKFKDDIEDKRSQMQLLEQRIVELGEQSSSYQEMSQAIANLTGQLNEKAFELEIRTADNRVLEEQLQAKVVEIRELQEKNARLQQQLQDAIQKSSQHKLVLGPQKINYLAENDDTGTWLHNGNLSGELSFVEGASVNRKLPSQYETSMGLAKKQDADRNGHEHVLLKAQIEILSQEKARLVEEEKILQAKNTKLEEEASYAKELASAAATEIKDLTEQIKKLVLQITKLSNEALAATSQVEALKEELRIRKEKQTNLEQNLSEKEKIEIDSRRKLDEAKQREADLENDLASMWVLIAKMKTEEPLKQHSDSEALHSSEKRPLQDDSVRTSAVVSTPVQDMSSTENIKRIKEQHKELERLRTSPSGHGGEAAELKALISQLKGEEVDNLDAEALEDLQTLHIEALTKLCNAKARIQERKRMEKEHGKEQTRSQTQETLEGGGLNSHFYDEDRHAHICKVCFEAATAAVLLPCRHFCLCQQCAVACTECPLCRSSITDRIITFAS